MTLSIGNAGHTTGSGNVSISTLGSSGVLVFIGTVNNTVQQTPSVASTTLGSWGAPRAYREVSGADFASISLFTKPFSSPLVSEVVTYTPGAGALLLEEFDVFEINGCALSSYFDANSGLPIETNAYPMSISTSNADDFIIAAYRGIGSATAGAGWTLISGGTYQMVQYKIVSAAQSGLSAPIVGGTPDTGVGDAIIAAAAAGLNFAPFVIGAGPGF